MIREVAKVAAFGISRSYAHQLELQCACGHWISVPAPGELVECLCGTRFETRPHQHAHRLKILPPDAIQNGGVYDGPPEERLATERENALLCQAGWQMTLIQTLWFHRHWDGFYSVDEALSLTGFESDHEPLQALEDRA